MPSPLQLDNPRGPLCAAVALQKINDEWLPTKLVHPLGARASSWPQGQRKLAGVLGQETHAGLNLLELIFWPC